MARRLHQAALTSWLTATLLLNAPAADAVAAPKLAPTCDLPPIDCTKSEPRGLIWSGISRCDPEATGTTWLTCEYIVP